MLKNYDQSENYMKDKSKGRYLEGIEVKIADISFREAREQAKKSPFSGKFGACITKNDRLLFDLDGFNSLPEKKGLYSSLYTFPKNKTTLCFQSNKEKYFCPIEKVLLNAMRKADLVSIEDSTIYLVKLNSENHITYDEEYFSKQGSKLALMLGVKELVFLDYRGPYAYTSEEYYELSFGDEKEE